MTRYVRDDETIRLLKGRATLRMAFLTGLIFLGGASYYFLKIDAPDSWLPIVYVGVGSSLLTFSACYFRYGLSHR